jgi:hypothetical protein
MGIFAKIAKCEEQKGGGGLLDGFEAPKPPVIFAGAVGGPMVFYTVTPARNALTIAASDTSLSIAGCYRDVFKNGLAGGWTGGIYPAIAACPQFLCLGPVFHAFSSVAGNWGGMVLTGMVETGIAYGAETKNAQLATIAKGSKIPMERVQNPMVPYGPGITLHISRNVLAMIGMRVLCDPITASLEKVTGQKSGAITLAGDFISNIAAAGLTFPIHQLFNYTVSTPEMWDKPQGEQLALMKDYLKKQYLVDNGSGGKKLSPVLLRDFGLRSLYIAGAYSAYINFERACIANWPF